eukprot:Sdes_comp20261_c0_seq1m13743
MERLYGLFTGIPGFTDCSLRVCQHGSEEVDIISKFLSRKKPLLLEKCLINYGTRIMSVFLPKNKKLSFLPVIFQETENSSGLAQFPPFLKKHKNRVTGIKGVSIAVADIHLAKTEFSLLTGQVGADRGYTVRYRMDSDTFLELQQATRWSGRAGASLARSGHNMGYYKLYLEYQGPSPPYLDHNDQVWNSVTLDFIKE